MNYTQFKKDDVVTLLVGGAHLYLGKVKSTTEDTITIDELHTMGLMMDKTGAVKMKVIPFLIKEFTFLDHGIDGIMLAPAELRDAFLQTLSGIVVPEPPVPDPSGKKLITA